MAINREKILEAAQKFAEKQKYDKAILELRKIMDADPNDARTLHRIGEHQAKQGLWAEAIDTFETVGKLYTQGGFATKAVAVYKHILEVIGTRAPQLAVRYGHIAPRLAELYCETGLNGEALTLFKAIANDLQMQQRDGEALEIFRRIAQLDPERPTSHLRLAEALSRARDFQGAVESFKTAAALLMQANRRDDAIQVLERLLQHVADPDQAWTCAQLYLSRGRLPQDAMAALAKLHICLQRNAQDVNVLGHIARCFDMIGQRDKANGVRAEIQRITQRR